MAANEIRIQCITARASVR